MVAKSVAVLLAALVGCWTLGLLTVLRELSSNLQGLGKLSAVVESHDSVAPSTTGEIASRRPVELLNVTPRARDDSRTHDPPKQSLPDTIPSAPLPTVEAPIDAATASSSRTAVLSVRVRCENWYEGFGMFPHETEDGSSYDNLSDVQLRAFADEKERGFAQYVYVQDRLFGLAVWNQIEGDRNLTLAAARMTTDEEFYQTVMGYLSRAIQNHNYIAAEMLAGLYFRTDPRSIEARAWLVVSDRAGGKALDRYERRAHSGLAYYFPDFEKEQSEIRADELIAEFDLKEGLSPPAECAEG